MNFSKLLKKPRKECTVEELKLRIAYQEGKKEILVGNIKKLRKELKE